MSPQRRPKSVQSPHQYQLIDFGDGRKLESLGDYRIDRPSPSAQGARRQNRSPWDKIDARFDADKKQWRFHRRWPEELKVDCGEFVMPVQPTPFGHIGLFPEQADNWRWLASPSAHPPCERDQSPEALNLFAYTGASTMALIAAGYRVAHVDAAKPNVQAARRTATANGWQDPPIRFLVDDAVKFTAREVRRGRRYHTIVLDPPAYGHSPQGRAWRLERDLWPLLDDCFKLLEPERFRLLVTGHSSHIGPDDIVRYLNAKQADLLGGVADRLRISAGRSQLRDMVSRPLDAGFFVRAEVP